MKNKPQDLFDLTVFPHFIMQIYTSDYKNSPQILSCIFQYITSFSFKIWSYFYSNLYLLQYFLGSRDPFQAPENVQVPTTHLLMLLHDLPLL
jgi:hypothetical protein